MSTEDLQDVSTSLLTDPLKFAALMWPDVQFYDKQAEVIQSVITDDVTVVPAGNMLGKDFVAGFIALWFFLSRSPCRVVTTSAKDDHLRVLWGEIGRFIQTARFPLDYRRGGPLIVNHHDIRRIDSNGTRCPLSYLKGMVAGTDSIAAMQGHHIASVGDGIPRTMFLADECSSVPDEYWQMATTWCNRALLFGNTWPCTNFFYRAIKGSSVNKDPGGTIFSKDGQRCYRRVIHVRAQDSPNVRLALQEIAAGREPSGRMVIPGVKSYAEYLRNQEMWDPIQRCVSLDAEFYEGAEVRMFPAVWLDRAHAVAERNRRRGIRTLGIDPAEGGDNSCWTVCDQYGIVHQETLRTPDTSQIVGRTIDIMKRFSVESINVLFDRGGGGKQHADRMRLMGHSVRTVGFGEQASDPYQDRRMRTAKDKSESREVRYVYKNRRAEMYGLLRELLEGGEFGIPREYEELRRQLSLIPLEFDAEGRMVLMPKDRTTRDSKQPTLRELLGCSPDEADSTVLAVFGLMRKSRRSAASMF